MTYHAGPAHFYDEPPKRTARQEGQLVCRRRTPVSSHASYIMTLCDTVPIDRPIKSGPFALKDIIHAVSVETGVSALEMMGSARFHRIIFARHLFCRLARVLTRFSSTQIGAFLGNRDHTTILHAIKNTERKFHKFQTAYERTIARLEARI